MKLFKISFQLFTLLTLFFSCARVEHRPELSGFETNRKPHYQAHLSLSAGGESAEITLTEVIRNITVEPKRELQLSKNHLVIIATNHSDEEIWRTVIMNPGFVHGHNYGDELSQKVEVYQAIKNFPVDVPVLPDLKEVKVYRPQYNGSQYELGIITQD